MSLSKVLLTSLIALSASASSPTPASAMFKAMGKLIGINADDDDAAAAAAQRHPQQAAAAAGGGGGRKASAVAQTAELTDLPDGWESFSTNKLKEWMSTNLIKGNAPGLPTGWHNRGSDYKTQWMGANLGKYTLKNARTVVVGAAAIGGAGSDDEDGAIVLPSQGAGGAGGGAAAVTILAARGQGDVADPLGGAPAPLGAVPGVIAVVAADENAGGAPVGGVAAIGVATAVTVPVPAPTPVIEIIDEQGAAAATEAPAQQQPPAAAAAGAGAEEEATAENRAPSISLRHEAFAPVGGATIETRTDSLSVNGVRTNHYQLVTGQLSVPPSYRVTGEIQVEHGSAGVGILVNNSWLVWAGSHVFPSTQPGWQKFDIPVSGNTAKFASLVFTNQQQNVDEVKFNIRNVEVLPQ